MLGNLFHIFLSAVVIGYPVEQIVAVNWDLVQSPIKYILSKNFTTEGPVLLLMSSDVQEDFPRLLGGQDLPGTLQCLEDMTLKFVHENSLWPLTVFEPEKDRSTFYDVPKVKNNGYVLFVNPQIEMFEDILDDSILNLTYESSWNSRSKFLIVAYGELGISPTAFAEIVFHTLTLHEDITNFVLLIFSRNMEVNSSFVMDGNMSLSDSITSLYAYTSFPYLNHACGEIVPSLIRKWNLDNGNNFTGVDYFSPKLPNNFMGCKLMLAYVGAEPYVIINNYTREDGRNDFVVTGLSVELLLLFARHRNFTLEFHDTIAEYGRGILDVLAPLDSGIFDILAGAIPVLFPIAYLIDISVPFLFDSVEFLVPCPRTIEKMENVVTLFSLSTWACMGLVFVLVSILLWCLTNLPIDKNNFTTSKLLTQSFSSAWAVLLGFSVPQMPVTIEMRFLFIVYVWYCFAMSTVFQAFFTAYLVEPGYEARLKTINDVKQAGLKFTSYELLDPLLGYIEYNELDNFERDRFYDITECIKSVMLDRKNFALSLSYFPNYLASVEGFKDERKIVCFLDESFIFISLGIGLPKGSPLLNILNEYILRYNEAGLLGLYWSRLKHSVNLKVDVADGDSEFVVFSLHHLGSMFILLIFGYILSVLVFLCECLVFKVKKNKRCKPGDFTICHS